MFQMLIINSHEDLSSNNFEVQYSINNNTLKESPYKQALSVLLHYLFWEFTAK